MDYRDFFEVTIRVKDDELAKAIRAVDAGTKEQPSLVWRLAMDLADERRAGKMLANRIDRFRWANAMKAWNDADLMKQTLAKWNSEIRGHTETIGELRERRNALYGEIGELENKLVGLRAAAPQRLPPGKRRTKRGKKKKR